MDWGTHVVLAVKLLGSCKLDKGAAIYSLLPAIDSQPAHYHRVYAHIIENQRIILDASLDILGGEEVRRKDYKALAERVKQQIADFQTGLREGNGAKNLELEAKIYAYRRIAEETKAFVDHVKNTAKFYGDDSIASISNDKMSAGISLISHLYFDTYNNPVQGFLPYSSVASAQWSFWDNVDYMRFRGEFYNEKNIAIFRQQMADSKVWNRTLNPAAVIKAMIIRVGEMGQPAIKYEIIDWVLRKFLRYMGVDAYHKADRELKFCLDVEAAITKAISSRFSKKEELLPLRMQDIVTT